MNSLFPKLNTVFLISIGMENPLTPGYLAGALLAMLILGYLIYSLIKPEKF